MRDAGNIARFLRGYLHPSFAHVGEYAWQCVVTVCIALWGTPLAVGIASTIGTRAGKSTRPPTLDDRDRGEKRGIGQDLAHRGPPAPAIEDLLAVNTGP